MEELIEVLADAAVVGSDNRNPKGCFLVVLLTIIALILLFIYKQGMIWV